MLLRVAVFHVAVVLWCVEGSGMGYSDVLGGVERISKVLGYIDGTRCIVWRRAVLWRNVLCCVMLHDEWCEAVYRDLKKPMWKR